MIAGQIRMEESISLRDSKVHVVQVIDLHLQLQRLQIQDVPPVLTISTNEVQVIPRDGDRLDVVR